ncbi:MAG TPA: ABC transporter permease [Thermomicrobiales bacterium]|nr:ABC transporter permease [Thermomicrobiales bacterium]
MATFILRRLAQMVPLVLLVTFITFGLINAAGSPVAGLEINPRVRPEDVARIKENLGLNEPWTTRYFVWLGNLLQGDLGISFVNSRPVLDQILNVLPNTLLLTGISVLVAIAVALPIGIYSAVRRNSLFDRITTIAAVAGFAVPSVWLGLLLIILFAVKFREWGLPYSFPVGGMRELRGESGFLDRVEHLILPVTALVIPQIASWTRYIRSSMLEIIRQDYVRTAEAKGLRERSVLYAHAFRNALLPLITLVGLSLPELFGGALIVENIFAWNGMGRLAYESIAKNDHSLVVGTTLFFAVLTILGNLVSDILYAVFDPRIRYD